MLNWVPRRVRLVKAAPQPTESGKQFNVVLERAGGETFAGDADADSVATELKATAQATLEALRKVVGQSADIQLRGVLPVAAFGENLIVVAIKVTHENQTQKLFGLCSIVDDRARAAASATLNAVNRFLGLG